MRRALILENYVEGLPLLGCVRLSRSLSSCSMSLAIGLWSYHKHGHIRWKQT